MLFPFRLPDECAATVSTDSYRQPIGRFSVCWSSDRNVTLGFGAQWEGDGPDSVDTTRRKFYALRNTKEASAAFVRSIGGSTAVPASSVVRAAGVLVVVSVLGAASGVEKAEAGPVPSAPAAEAAARLGHEAAIAGLTKRCEPATIRGDKKERSDAFHEERDCLERALRAEMAQTATAAPRTRKSSVGAIAAQEPARRELRETLCHLEEELFWVDFAGRWRRDGTMRGELYGRCVLDVLREQNYFWQVVRNNGAAALRKRADEGFGRTPYVAGVLSDIENAANSLLARKVLPGRRERHFVGEALGPGDYLKLAAASRRARELADGLGSGTCAGWPELRSAFANEGDCTRRMSGYYVALSGMLDDGKPFKQIPLEETP
jgi:hypothetical protein